MFDVGFPEIAVILVISLVLFGPKKLPEIGKSLGRTLRELKRASNELMTSLDQPEEPEHHLGDHEQKEGEQ